MSKALPLRDAAKVIGRSDSTLRAWLAEGAPCVREGQPGRNRGALVDPLALVRWRRETSRRREVLCPDATPDDLIARATSGLVDAYKLGPYDEPAYRSLGLDDYQAAALLAHTFLHVARHLTGRTPDVLPRALQTLLDATGKPLARKRF
jgi:hypothetical protein